MKSPTHLDKCIVCPKCGTKTMRKALGKNPVAEYFDDKCHQYFTIEELVNEWNYDLGDFGDCGLNVTAQVYNLVLDKKFTELDLGETEGVWLVTDKLIATTWFNGDSVSVVDEPVFKSPSERWEAYQMVDRMFLDIPEWSMENNEIDTGALHP